MPPIQSTVSDTLAASIEAAAQARGVTVSAFVRDTLATSLATEGTFFGVTMKSANDGTWFSHAMPYAQADVVDGSLVLRNAGGAAQVLIAPGRWRECSRRIAVDRPLFTGEAVKDQAD